MQLGFGENIGVAEYNTLTATNTPKTDAIATKISINGLNVCNTAAAKH